jgi:membrane protease YdiL (CAAX protease family)
MLGAMQALPPGLEPAQAPSEPQAGAGPAPAIALSASRGLGFVALYLAAQLLAGLLIGAGVGLHYVLAGGDPTDTEAVRELVTREQGLIGIAAALVGSLVFVGLVAARYRGGRWKPFRLAVGLTAGSARAAALGVGSGVVVALLYAFAMSFFAPPPNFTPGPLTQMSQTPGLQREVWTWFGLLASPPLEEFIIRGVLLACFAASWGNVAAAIATTLFFVGLHYSEISGFWPAASGITAMALVVVTLRIRTGSLVPAVCGHLGYNLVLVALVRASAP